MYTDIEEMVFSEDLQYMMLTFDAKMVEYKVMGDDKLRDVRDELPFWEMPDNV